MEINPFNLTKIELRIFNEILKLKEAPLGKIIKNLGIHKGTAYNSICRLKEKGLVSYKKIGKVDYYSIMPLSLKAFIEEENQKFIEKKKQINSIIEIAKRNKEDTGLSGVQVLVGEKGFKSFFNDLYEWAYKNKKEYLFLGKGEEIARHLGLEYYKLTQAKKRRLKIRCRVILDKNSAVSSIRKYRAGDIRYLDLDQVSAESTWVYGNHVVIVLWDAKPLLTIIIESSAAANNYKSFFENLWTSASSSLMKFESRHKVNLYDFITGAKKSLDIYGICCAEPLHEGRYAILNLIKKGKKIRVLFSNPFGQAFKKRVFLEERFITDLNESRILFEMKSALANLKDVQMRTKKIIDFRFTDSKPSSTIVIVDGKNILYNRYADKPGEYGSSKYTVLIDNQLNPSEGRRVIEEFEKKWSEAKSIPFNKIL